MVEIAGLEPTASCSQSKPSTIGLYLDYSSFRVVRELGYCRYTHNKAGCGSRTRTYDLLLIRSKNRDNQNILITYKEADEIPSSLSRDVGGGYGNRTHTVSPPPDFESGASASSANPPSYLFSYDNVDPLFAPFNPKAIRSFKINHKVRAISTNFTCR